MFIPKLKINKQQQKYLSDCQNDWTKAHADLQDAEQQLKVVRKKADNAFDRLNGATIMAHLSHPAYARGIRKAT